MRLSVIIPCYNAATTIAGQLDALTGQRWTHQWEVIVVNNHSTDGSMEVVERYRTRLPQLRIVDAFARRSRPHALNVGAAAAAGESLAFCDADDEMGAGWVAAIGDALLKHDFVASRFDAQKLNAAWVQRVRGPGQTADVPRIWYPPYLSYAGCCGLGVKRDAARTCRRIRRMPSLRAGSGLLLQASTGGRPASIRSGSLDACAPAGHRLRHLSSSASLG